MVGVMVMTPVHMGHAGGGEDAVLRVIGLVISVHVAGMYLFSPLVGVLADRVGAPPVVALGGVLLLVAAAVSGTAGPSDSVQLGVGLLLLGLGWSCGLIAGSTLVTASVDADLRPTAQGGTDLLMGLGAALAGAIGGPLLAGGSGWWPGSRPRWSAAGRRAGACVASALAVVPDQQDESHQCAARRSEDESPLEPVPGSRPSLGRPSGARARLASGCAPAGVLVPAGPTVRGHARPERVP